MKRQHMWAALFSCALSAAAAAQTTPPAKPGAGPATTAPAAKAADKAADKSTKTAGDAVKKPRQVFILSQKGMVGAGLRHEEMDKIEAEADKFGPGQIIILRINSGGGSVTEGDRISRSLSRIREKHRLVAWLEEAISGASFTAMHCPEIYFMKIGTMGSITKFSGDGSGGQKSAEGADLQAWIERVAEVAEAGGRNGQVGRAMVYSPIVVSYTKDPKTGKVTFFPDKSGEVMLSDEKDNLTFNADRAVDCGYINGVADTTDELFAAMQLAPGTYEVNDAGKRISDQWDRTLEKAKKQRTEIEQDMRLASDPGVKSLQKRIQLYKQMQDIWKKALPVAEGIEGGGPLLPPGAEELGSDLVEKYMVAGSDLKPKIACEIIDRCIKDLQKQLAAAKKGA